MSVCNITCLPYPKRSQKVRFFSWLERRIVVPGCCKMALNWVGGPMIVTVAAMFESILS